MHSDRTWTRGIVAALVGLATIGCDIPTKAPIITQVFLVPVKGDSVTVSQFLNSGQVTVSAGQFVVNAGGGTSQTLTWASLCGAACPTGGTFPRPAITGNYAIQYSNPSTVNSVTLGSGVAIQLTITNSLGFDPICTGGIPVAGAFVRTNITSNGLQITRDSSTACIPTGSSSRLIQLPTGAVLGQVVNAAVTLSSPAGGNVTLPATPSLAYLAVPVNVRATQATVQILNQAVSSSSASLSFSSVDTTVQNRVDSAAVELTLTNPIQVSGSVNARFQANGIDVIAAKQVVITGQPSQAVRIPISGTEIRTLLSSSTVLVSLNGSVTGPAPSNLVVVTPSTKVTLASNVRLFTRTGS